MNRLTLAAVFIAVFARSVWAVDPAPMAAKPQVFNGTISKPLQDAANVATVIGHHGVLFISSEARWNEINKLTLALTPDTPLTKLDFAKQSVVVVFAMGGSSNNSLTLDKSDLTANPPELGFTLKWYNGPVAGLEMPSMKFIHTVIPATPVVKVTLTSEHLFVIDRYRIVTEFSALLGGKDGGDVVDGRQAAITPKATTIKPGDDILIDFVLHLADPGKAKPEQFGTTRNIIYVWDGKYSNAPSNSIALDSFSLNAAYVAAKSGFMTRLGKTPCRGSSETSRSPS